MIILAIFLVLIQFIQITVRNAYCPIVFTRLHRYAGSRFSLVVQSGIFGSKSTGLQLVSISPCLLQLMFFPHYSQSKYIFSLPSICRASDLKLSDLSSNIFTVLFETGVLIVTASKVWGVYCLEKSSKSETDRLSLGTLCLRQSKSRKTNKILLAGLYCMWSGVLRFAYVKLLPRFDDPYINNSIRTILLFGVEQAISLNVSLSLLSALPSCKLNDTPQLSRVCDSQCTIMLQIN